KLQAPDGKKIDLKSFKGKLIYIDLWATWCGPCIQEIPYLQQLENDYRDEHIVFLSLSMDAEKDYIKWKNFLVEYPLTGHQFWLDAENRDRISKSFNVTQIPRFILLDKKLRVIDANAPRPSSSEI